MNIHAKKGHKVIVTNETAKNGYKPDREIVVKWLEIGQIYTIEKTVVFDFHTEVYLREIPDVPFNSVNFEDLENYLVTLGFEINNQPDEDFYTKEKRPDRIIYEKKHKYISYIISFEPDFDPAYKWYLIIKINDNSYYGIHLENINNLNDIETFLRIFGMITKETQQ